MRVAINGFGRIGRNFVRAVSQRDSSIEIVAINDLSPLETSKTLLKYDSILGANSSVIDAEETELGENYLHIDGKSVLYLSEKNPELLPWAYLDVDLVIEATGIFVSREQALMHVQAGAKRVLITAPATDPDATVVFGVNESVLTSDMQIISNASCTTNCLAPLVRVLDDAYGLQNGSMVTVHAYTNDQNLMDSPHKDLRRARAAAINMIPTSTGAAKAVAEVLPHLRGKLDGYAIRVPVPTGSMISLTATFEYTPSVSDVNDLLKAVSESDGFSSIIEYTDDPIVSSDIVGNSHSTIFDSGLTKVVDNLVTVVAWYDNEWGYTNRLIDLAELLRDLN